MFGLLLKPDLVSVLNGALGEQSNKPAEHGRSV